VDAAHARWARGLEFRELRRGAQAVSDVYVHKRKSGAIAQRAADGRGKRAAFIVYYGGLHLLLVQHWMEQRPAPIVERVLDHGCGPGVVGAAAARWCGGARLTASDRVGRHLEVASWTGRHFGLKVQTRKQNLPGAIGIPSVPSLLIFGWVLNELSDPERQSSIERMARAIRAGSGALVFAPLSLRASPWWPDLARSLRRVRADGLIEEEYRFQPDRPRLIADLDRATRLNHQSLGARVLYVPPRSDVRPAMDADAPR
jgi:SAM-dependent methyltransferase